MKSTIKLSNQLSSRILSNGGLLLFIICVYVKNIGNLAIPASFLLVLYILIAALADRTDILALTFCCIPFGGIFQNKFAILFCMFIYFIKFRKDFKRHIPIYTAPIFIMMFWELLHIDASFSVNSYWRAFCEIIFCGFLMLLNYKTIEIDRIFRLYSISLIAMCILCLVLQLQHVGGNIQILFLSGHNFSSPINDLQYTPGFNRNELAYFCLIGIQCITISLMKRKKNVINIILLIALAVFGLMTLSRKFIICLAISFVLLLFANKEFKSKIKYLLVTGIVLAIIVYIIQKEMPTLYLNILRRFNEADLTGGRTNLFSLYNQHIFSSLYTFLYGTGLLGYYTELESIYHYTQIPHNGIQELIVIWGIFGLIVHALFVYCLIRSASIKNRNLIFKNLIPLIVLLVYCQGAQMISNGKTNMLFGLCYICMLINMKELKEEVGNNDFA